MTLTSRAACDLRHPGLATTIRGGLLPPNPQRPAAGYEIFFQSFGPGPYHGGGDAGAAGRSGPRARSGSGSTATVTSSRTVAGIYMMTTPNFGGLWAQGSKIQLKKTKAANRVDTTRDLKKYSYTRF